MDDPRGGRFAADSGTGARTNKAYKSRLGDLRNEKGPLRRAFPGGVSDGTRTRDHLDHNQELYQLSYAHQVRTAV